MSLDYVFFHWTEQAILVLSSTFQGENNHQWFFFVLLQCSTQELWRGSWINSYPKALDCHPGYSGTCLGKFFLLLFYLEKLLFLFIIIISSCFPFCLHKISILPSLIFCKPSFRLLIDVCTLENHNQTH